LLWLEQEHKCGASTCNHRLAVLQAIMRYVSAEGPEHLSVCSAVLSIKSKRTAKKTIDFLTIEELKNIFTQPDVKTAGGKRDLAILTLLYDSGARVQEIIDLKLGDVHLASPATIKLCGKGNKARIVPIMPETAKFVSDYTKAFDLIAPESQLFKGRIDGKFSRSGIEFVISKYVKAAAVDFVSLSGKKVAPHVFRHSKAMHLIQAGVNIVYIRDLLGHVSVQTTEVYAKADSEAKRKALVAASKNILPASKYSVQKKSELLDWLKHMV